MLPRKWLAFPVMKLSNIPYSEDMQQMFDPCVEKTLELIDGQIKQVQQKGSRVKVSHLF